MDLDRKGLRYLMPLGFQNGKDKRQVQANLERMFRRIDAKSVVMLSEAWISDTLQTKVTPVYKGSIKDIPGREEAVLVNALSA